MDKRVAPRDVDKTVAPRGADKTVSPHTLHNFVMVFPLLVVLAPYGLSGMLTGVTYKDMDLTTQHLLEQWRQFYVLKDNVRDGQDPSRIPPAVEVVVGKYFTYIFMKKGHWMLSHAHD